MQNTRKDRARKTVSRKSNAADKTRASRSVRRAAKRYLEDADGRPRAYSDRWGFVKEF